MTMRPPVPMRASPACSSHRSGASGYRSVSNGWSNIRCWMSRMRTPPGNCTSRTTPLRNDGVSYLCEGGRRRSPVRCRGANPGWRGAGCCLKYLKKHLEELRPDTITGIKGKGSNRAADRLGSAPTRSARRRRSRRYLEAWSASRVDRRHNRPISARFQGVTSLRASVRILVAGWRAGRDSCGKDRRQRAAEHLEHMLCRE